MEPKVFSIIAATCYGNRGAQAMLETVIGRLSDASPGLRFHVFTYYPDDDRRIVDDPRVSLHSSTPLALVAWLLPWALLFGVLRRVFGHRILALAPVAIRALGNSTALVDLAGVAFIDGREKFLPFNTLTLLPAWLLGTRVVKMPQAMGPFDRPVNRLFARLVLPMCRMVWARGGRTFEHLAQSGFSGVRFAQADDIAFNFHEAWSLTHEGDAPLRKLFERLDVLRNGKEVRGVVGICPSAVVAVKSRQEGGQYESVLGELVCDLSAKGFIVVLFPNATRDVAGDAERNNDLPLIRRILDDCLRANIEQAPLILDFDVNAAGIKCLIAQMDIVLVSRFHAMVGALSLGVPAAVLGWSHKYAEVMARFGMDANVMDYQQLSPHELRAAVERVFEQRAEMHSRIMEQLPAVKASAERPILALLTPSLGADLA
ncbi:polysaccharide pyruvyl transferase family protein [Luteimonas sp. A478]